MSATSKIFAKSIAHFIIMVFLMTLFFWTAIEGLLEQIANHHLMSMAFYLLSFLAGLAAVYNYNQAKTLFHYAEISG